MEAQQPQKDSSLAVNKLAAGIVISTGLIIALIMIITCFYRPVAARGPSMEPTLVEGDIAIAQVFGYHPARGDVVIIKDQHREGKYIVKRIIGMPGDSINIDFATGKVYLNGEELSEPYLNELTRTWGDIAFPLTVPENHVFVMGDNRNHSTDSRTSYTGMIPEENIEGRVRVKIYPLGKFGVGVE